MEDRKFKVIIVEDVKLELKGTEEIFRHEIPNAEVIGTAMTEAEFWPLMEAQLADLVLLDLGLGGSTTIGVDICRNIFKRYKGVRVLIFTGEILNEKLWVDVLNAGADGIILKTGELLRNRKRLREETLNLACARNGQFVFIGKLVHAHYSNDVHKFVVTLQYALNFAGNCIVFIADNFAGEDSAC